ncbi:182 kDa tankyrase-1-binding protein isoform X2 [Eleutherodactylus coqui]|uniref:182 kDa tankyrase-1-binding protein isoform X2 n=1 Tax=Eleutherodactylus coqui TaxID=57060 RepID=UPI0034629DC5
MSTSNSQQILDKTEPLGGVKPPIKPKPLVPPRPKEIPRSENKSPLLSPTCGPLSPTSDIPSALKISQLTGPQPYGTRRASLKRWSSSVGEEVNQDNNPLVAVENKSADLPAKSTAQPLSAPIRPLQTGAVWKGKSPFMLTTRGWGEQRSTQSRDCNRSESASQKPAPSLVSKDTAPQKKETTAIEENTVVNLKSHSRTTPEEKAVIPNIQDSKASTEKVPSRVSEEVKMVSSGSDSSNAPPEIKEFQKQISPPLQSDLHVESSKHVSQYDHKDIMAQSTGSKTEEKVPSIPVRKSLPVPKMLDENVKNAIVNNNQIPLEGSEHTLLHDDISVDQGHLENKDKNHQPGAHVDLHDVQQIGGVIPKEHTQDTSTTYEELSQHHDKQQPKDKCTSELSPPKPKERKKPSVQFNVPKSDDQAEGEISLDYRPTVTEAEKQETKEHTDDGNADMRRWHRELGVEEKPSSSGEQKTYEESVEVKQGMPSGIDELSDFMSTQMTSYKMTTDNGIRRDDMINKAPTDYTRSHGSERHDAPIPEHIDVGQPDVRGSSFHHAEVKVTDEEVHSIPHATKMYENVKHEDQDIANKQVDDDVDEDHRGFNKGRPEADSDVKNMKYMPHFTHTQVESSPALRSQHENDHKDGSQYYNVHSPNVQDGEKLEHEVDESKDHRYLHSHLEGPLQERALSGELVHPYAPSQGLDHAYEPYEKPVNTCTSSKEIGHTYAPSEELVHTYKSSEEPVHIYAQPVEPSRTYTQFEEPDHTYIQSEEPVHTYAQSEKPVNTFEQSEQLVYPYAQSEEPMPGYSQSEEETHKYAVLKTARPAYDESHNLVYTYKEAEKPVPHNIQSEEECQGYAVLKKAKYECDQPEKPDQTYDLSEEPIPHNVQSEELLHRSKPSKTSTLLYEQSEKQVDPSEELTESYPQDTQPKEPEKVFDHTEKTFVKHTQPEDPEMIISHGKQLDDLHYQQTQAEEPISKNYLPEKIISSETPSELPNYQQAQSEELHYQKEESKEQNYLQAQSHEPNYKLAHPEEPNYLQARSKGPNYNQPQSEDPDYQHAQSKECYQQEHSEEPNYQQAGSKEPNNQQARPKEPNYQQARPEEPNYQQAQSEEPNYQQARSEEPNSQQAQSEELHFRYTQPENLKYKDKSSEESHLIGYNLEQSQKEDVQTLEGKPKVFAEKNGRLPESTEREYMDLHAVETDSRHVTVAEQNKVESRPEKYLEQQHRDSPPEEYHHKDDSTSETYHKELLSKEQEARHVEQEGTLDAHTVKPELSDVLQEQTSKVTNRHSQSNESHTVESEDTRTADRLDKHTYIEKNVNGQSELNESEDNEDRSGGPKQSEEISEESPGESVSDTEESPEESNFDFIEGTGVLDTSLMRGRASLGKKRCHRTPVTGTCTSQEETDPEYWMFRDSTDPKFTSEKETDNGEKEETSSDCTPENSPTSGKSTKKGGIFSGIISPSILKGRLKSRNKASQEEAAKTEPKESQEPTSPGKDKSESSSHSLNWLQALKKKKKKQPK